MTLIESIKVLGLSRIPSQAELQVAYRVQSKKCHPDRGGSNEAFSRLSIAYRVVKDHLAAAAARETASEDAFIRERVGSGELMRESTFQGQLIRQLEDVKAFVFNVHGHGMQKSGIPDLYVASELWTGWFELKVGNNGVSAIQEIQIIKMRKVGVDSCVLRYRDGVVSVEDPGDLGGWVEAARIVWSRRGFGKLLLETLSQRV